MIITNQNIGGNIMEKSDKENEDNTENIEKESVKEFGTQVVPDEENNKNIQLITIIGEIEGHESASGNAKTTKYEHLLPILANIEENPKIEGTLILLNTLGGDVEAGLAIAEMIASLSKPTVSLVLGGSHSIGGPLAVAADYSYIVPSGTMVIHPVRASGMVIGVLQSFRNIIKTQDRITKFISDHSKISVDRIETLMLNSQELVKDVGTMLVGREAVKEGIIDEVGGIKEAFEKLHELIKIKNDRD